MEDLKRGRRNESALAIQPENPSASEGDYYDGLVVGIGGIGDGVAGGEGGGGSGASSLTALLASAGVVCSLLAAVALLTAFNAKKRRLRGGGDRLWPATATTESSNRLVGT